MEISAPQLAKFQELYKKQLGVAISEKDALEEGIALIELIQTMKNEYERINRRGDR